MQHRLRRTFCLLMLTCGTGLLAQSSAPTYPKPRKGDVVDNYFGTAVADPYRWMEDLNAPELKPWVDAENAVTFRYLDALPLRDRLKARITELWNYPKVSVPRYEGRHWFYTRNSGLQRQSVVFTRETLNGSETVALDSEQPVARRRARAVRLHSVARRPALRVRAVRGRLGLVHLLRARAVERQAAAGRDPLGQVQQPRLDAGRQGLLLRPLP